MKYYGEVVGGVDVIHETVRCRFCAANPPLEQGVECPFHVARSKQPPIVKGHAAMQLENVGQRIRDIPMLPSPGATFKCSSRVSSASKMSSPIRSDCASIPTRGSRFVGLLSMIITRVLGSGAGEQEREDNKNPPRNDDKIVNRRNLVILTLSEPKGKDLLFAICNDAAL